jgi:hypothetical protein
MNEERIPKKENPQEEDRDEDWKSRLGKMSQRRAEGHMRYMRKRSFGKTEMDGEGWLLGDLHEVKKV